MAIRMKRRIKQEIDVHGRPIYGTKYVYPNIQKSGWFGDSRGHALAARTRKSYWVKSIFRNGQSYENMFSRLNDAEKFAKKQYVWDKGYHITFPDRQPHTVRIVEEKNKARPIVIWENGKWI